MIGKNVFNAQIAPIDLLTMLELSPQLTPYWIFTISGDSLTFQYLFAISTLRKGS